jgi:hypothetical protein
LNTASVIRLGSSSQYHRAVADGSISYTQALGDRVSMDLLWRVGLPSGLEEAAVPFRGGDAKRMFGLCPLKLRFDPSLLDDYVFG